MATVVALRDQHALSTLNILAPPVSALKEDARMSRAELARLVKVEQPTTVQLLARRERDGLIRRVPRPV